MGTGLLSWRYNYAQAMTGLFVGKLILSVVYIVLVVIALLLRFFVIDDPTVHDAAFWSYVVTVLGIPPCVVAAGYMGGKITFPS